MAVASGASDLLDILLQRAWGLVMQDVADVGLVDAHAKGGGRDHDEASGWVHELPLGRITIGSTHLAVIARDRDACAPECARDFIDGGGRGAIDDARALQTLDAAGGDGELGRTRHNVDGQAKVLAVSRRDNDTGLVQAKPFGDVLPDPWGCRRGKGERRRIAHTFAGVAEAQVGGPEIVSPFGDAVSLVDAQESWPETFKEGRGCGRLERFGRREHDQAAAFFEPVECSPPLGRAQPAVKRNHRDAAALQSAFLIRHEGNERRDNNRRPMNNHRRDLIDQRFAKAGRQRHQGIASVEDGEHRRFLFGPQGRDTKDAARGLPAGIEQAHAAVVTAWTFLTPHVHLNWRLSRRMASACVGSARRIAG